MLFIYWSLVVTILQKFSGSRIYCVFSHNWILPLQMSNNCSENPDTDGSFWSWTCILRVRHNLLTRCHIACCKFHLLLMNSSWCCIFYNQQCKRKKNKYVFQQKRNPGIKYRINQVYFCPFSQSLVSKIHKKL